MTDRFVTVDDPADYQVRVSAFLEADAVAHTLPLTVLHQVVAGEYADRVLGCVERSTGDSTTARTVAVGIQTPPHNLLVAASDRPAVRSLAHGLSVHGCALPGVTASVPWAQEFAAVWSALTGLGSEEVVRERLFRLDLLIPPRRCRGRARPAGEPDLDLLTSWVDAFQAEAMPESPPIPAPAIAAQVRDGQFWLWEADGGPTALVRRSPLIAGQARIGPVYTPTDLRGRGFAGNLVAHVSAQVLHQGVPTLLADLTNPTSNHIYTALGYRPVTDAAMIAFV